MTADLKKYVCMYPFTYLDIQSDNAWICCPSWAPTPVSEFRGTDSEIKISSDWYKGEAIKNIRKSVTDGTFSHCNKTVCPFLSKLVNTGKHPGRPIVSREYFDDNILKGRELDDFIENYDSGPEHIVFGFDRACNLKCPSCRPDVVINDKEGTPEQDKKHKIISIIDDDFSNSAKTMMITGSGDPFYSRIFRDYLIEFDVNKYPNLDQIQIITNGNLLTEKMWNSLNAKQFIRTVEFSVDAGTKDTYENTTRLNGNWDKLLTNVEYIASQPEIRLIMISMVVSQLNYTEMEDFYNTFNNILKKANYKNNVSFNYRRIVYWSSGKYHPDDIRNISVFDREHPEHDRFLFELNKVKDLPKVTHNFHEVLVNE